jgi:hypothetical protein
MMIPQKDGRKKIFNILMGAMTTVALKTLLSSTRHMVGPIPAAIGLGILPKFNDTGNDTTFPARRDVITHWRSWKSFNPQLRGYNYE